MARDDGQLDPRVASARAALQRHHAAVRTVHDDESFAEMVRLTSALLDVEAEKRAAEEGHARGVSGAAVYGVAALLVLGVAALVVLERVAGWDFLGVALTFGLALTLVVVHTTVSAERHRDGRQRAAAALIGGAGLLLVVAGVVPWWADVMLLAVAAAAAGIVLGLLPTPRR